MSLRDPLRSILLKGQTHWDHDGVNPDVRQAFRRATQCRTPALGAEVYASSTQEKVVNHTCKSKACSSCGYRATVQWQRERYCALPRGRCLAVTLSMPSQLWGFFRDNPKLAEALPALTATALQVQGGYGRRLGVQAILHTFNGQLNYNSHVHAMVSGWAMGEGAGSKVKSLYFPQDAVMQRWRRLVIRLLREALDHGQLLTEMTAKDVESLLARQESRSWIVKIQRFTDTEHFLRYAGRYVRRPPIAQHRIKEITEEHVRFVYKDKKRNHNDEVHVPMGEFIQRWMQHIPRKYSHSVRHFGLFAPRALSQTASAVFALLGQTPRTRPRRLRWAESIQRDFGWNPLLDKNGQRMTWARRIAPIT